MLFRSALITNYGEPNLTAIPIGTWRFDTYYAIDSAAGTTQFVYKVYKRNLAGTETLLATATSDQLTNTTLASPLLQITDYTFTSVNYLLATDRLVLKIYVQTTNTSTVNVYYYYEGTDHYSFLATGIFQGTQGASGYSGYSGYSGLSGYSGYSGRSGYSGYSAASGYSGYSGTSGYSGYSEIGRAHV